MYEAHTQFAKMLRNLDNWILKAEAHAKTKNFEPETFVQLRLVPDMYALVKQVQSACDSAKFTASYLTGKEAPSHPDTETTLAQIHARIHTVLAHRQTYTEKDFEGWADRKVSPKWLGGKWMRGDHYLMQAGIPNFYFHVTTAYNILRHNGVDLGKMDYMGNMPIQG